MPSQSLINSTTEPLEHSAGLSLADYMTPFDPSHLPNTSINPITVSTFTSFIAQGSPNFSILPVNTLELTATDRCAGGLVQFNTRMTMTGDDLSAIAPAALSRLICYYVVGQLSDKSLMDACQSLTEIYAWQNRPTPAVPEQSTRHLGKAAVRKTERAPFAFREE
jgi:hypothetical protein